MCNIDKQVLSLSKKINKNELRKWIYLVPNLYHKYPKKINSFLFILWDGERKIEKYKSYFTEN